MNGLRAPRSVTEFSRRAGGFGRFGNRPTGICFPLIITLLAPTSQVDRAEARGAFFEEGVLTTLGPTRLDMHHFFGELRFAPTPHDDDIECLCTLLSSAVVYLLTMAHQLHGPPPLHPTPPPPPPHPLPRRKSIEPDL